MVTKFGANYWMMPTPNSAAKYTVMHTTTLYLLDTAGLVRLEFRHEASADEIVKGLREILAAT